jgi:hypothetical protein
VRDALHDDAGLAGAGSRDDDQRSLAVLDDGALLVGQRSARVGGVALIGSWWRYRDVELLPSDRA